MRGIGTGMARLRALVWSCTLAGAFGCALGCGGGGGGAAAAPTDESSTAASGAEEAPTESETVVAEEDVGYAAEDESLPAPPWAADPVTAGDAPTELLTAWSEADNRTWCAPLAPALTDDASARATEYAGGWAVEFDQRGAPGVRANGRPCARCGRAAFGIAGTAIRVDEADPGEAEEERFRDGSFVRVEPSEEEEGDVAATAASIRVRGQECVYQVWSLISEDHLRELVAGLRFVDAP